MCIKDLVFEMDATVNDAILAVRKQLLMMKYVLNDFFTYRTSDEQKALQWDELGMLLNIVNDYGLETDKLLGELRGLVDSELEAVTAGKEGA